MVLKIFINTIAKHHVKRLIAANLQFYVKMHLRLKCKTSYIVQIDWSLTLPTTTRLDHNLRYFQAKKASLIGQTFEGAQSRWD